MLMACLKYLSRCPCPCCLLLKSRIPLLGTKSDTRERLQLARVDSVDRCEKVKEVRHMLFDKDINITSIKIDQKLKDESLVPT